MRACVRLFLRKHFLSFFNFSPPFPSSAMNTKYSFCSEVHKKYSRKIYEMFESIFEYLPLVTLVEKEIFIVHGGTWICDLLGGIFFVALLNLLCIDPINNLNNSFSF